MGKVKRPPFLKGSHYYAGIDLGQMKDYSAVIIAQRDTFYEVTLHKYVATYAVRHIERFPLETEYPVIVNRIHRLCERPEMKLFGRLVVDQTGVGIAVVDMMKQYRLSPIGITITGGHEVVKRPGGFNVPKKEVVTSLLTVFQGGRMKMAELDLTDELVKELENFRVKQNTRTGYESFEAWRERDHDDLVLALAIAIWYAETQDAIPQHLGHYDDVTDWDPLNR